MTHKHKQNDMPAISWRVPIAALAADDVASRLADAVVGVARRAKRKENYKRLRDVCIAAAIAGIANKREALLRGVPIKIQMQPGSPGGICPDVFMRDIAPGIIDAVQKWQVNNGAPGCTGGEDLRHYIHGALSAHGILRSMLPPPKKQREEVSA